MLRMCYIDKFLPSFGSVGFSISPQLWGCLDMEFIIEILNFSSSAMMKLRHNQFYWDTLIFQVFLLVVP